MTPPIRPNVREPARGGFFQIDRRTWAHVTQLGLNPAVAYLVLARGTGPDNRTTCWSVQSIEKYTGISRSRASRAIKSLQKDGSVQLIRGGTKPKYELIPWSELEQNRAPARKPMTERQRTVFEMVAAGEQPKGSDAQVAAHLARAGWLARDASSRFFIPSETEPSEPDWIWLPNELVTRAASEIPPVELVRQSQDVMTLRLLVDFYHSQNLREEGGIGRHFTWQKFERFEVGRQAQFTIWGFCYESDWVGWNGPTTCHRRDTLTDEEKAEGKNPGVDFFRRQQQLADLGLIEWIPHLFESADPDAEICAVPAHCGH